MMPTSAILISILGAGNYQEVTYALPDDNHVLQYTTRFFPLALAQWFSVDRVLVLLTPEAAQHPNWHQLREQLGPQAQPVTIPAGKREQELWQIFDRLAEVVPPHARLLLDVTHGFRTLPLFVVVAALFLRRVRQATIERVLYGAYEARDPTGIAPVFDLTPLVDLADWLSGVEALEYAGDGRLLAERLRQTHNALWRERREATNLPRRLKTVGDKLSEFSQAVWLNRPREAINAADRLTQELQAAHDELAQWAHPFALLADNILDQVKPVAHTAPDQLSRENLAAQLALITYALQKGLVLQAITLSREWLVSWWLLEHFPDQRERWLARDVRQKVEEDLNTCLRLCRQGSSLAEQLTQMPAVELWDSIQQLRNDLAHGGMRQNPTPFQAVRDRAHALITQLSQLLTRPSSDMPPRSPTLPPTTPPC